jgi:hypothetical protein
LKLTVSPLLAGECHTLLVANGTKLEIVGKIELQVNIKGLTIPYCFLVLENLHHALLLGIDFLNFTKAKIDLRATQFHFVMILLRPPSPQNNYRPRF